MPVAEFGGVGAAVLFSVCCRRHLFCLASVLFVERNTFGTTHFFRCDPVLRLGPRIFFQCDPVLLCVCEMAKGGLRYPHLFSSLPPAVPHLAHLRVGQVERHDRSVPHLRDPWRPMLDDIFDISLRHLSSTSSTTSTIFFLPNLVPSTGWGPAERAFPFKGSLSGGPLFGGAEAAERFDPSLSSVVFHWTAGGGRRTVAVAFSLSALEAWKMRAGSVRGRRVRRGRVRRAEDGAKRQWQCGASVQGLQNGCSGAGLGWCEA